MAVEPLISVVIVNYRVPGYLLQALRSLRDARLYDKTEVIVVDNASGDNSRKLVTSEFPEVRWFDLKTNIGFGRACNVGAQNARGTWLLLLNPDTLISKNTLDVCVTFMNEHPHTGLLGPKILNADGTLQVSCRRSFPTPMVSFFRFIGLSKIFPKSRLFARYNLTYMDPDVAGQVDAVSGSFMFMPLKLYRSLEGFDERFFMYGEDLDLCARVKQQGREVWYTPATEIIHFKGKSSPHRSLKVSGAFYKAMFLFSRKHQHTYGAFFPNWLILIGIVLWGAGGIGASLFRTFTATFIDLLIVNVLLWAGLTIRFMYKHLGGPYEMGDPLTMAGMHYLISICYLGVFAYRRIYTKEGYSASKVLVAAASASVIFMACIFFLKSMAYSRIALACSSALICLCLVGWRELLPRATKQFKRLIYSTGNVIVLGDSEVAAQLIEMMEKDKSAHINGVIWPIPGSPPGEFRGYQVLGTIDQLPEILARERADLLLIATGLPWYSHIIRALSSRNVKNLTIQWVPLEIFNESPDKLPQQIPLLDFSV